MQAEALAHTREEVSKTLDIDPGAREVESPKPKKKVFKVVDGIEFETESAYRRHLYQTQYSFIDREGETLIRRPGDIGGQSHDLCNLKNCEVQLLDHSAQVLCDRLVDCKVFIGPCESDVFIRDCENCTFTIACKQLRVRDCSHCQVYLYSYTRPALETSHHMAFANFNGAYPRLGIQFRKAKLDPEYNKWDQVHDFSRSDPAIPKPHWTELPAKDKVKWEISFPNCNGKPENPVGHRQNGNALWFTQANGMNAATPRSGKSAMKGLKKASIGGAGKSLFRAKSF